MNTFDDRMRRLKNLLGLTQDKDVAAALGMTKASLSDRKRRGSFPDDRVVALVAKHPDFDIQYVLTGKGGIDRRSQNAKLAAAQAAGTAPLASMLDDIVRQGDLQRSRMTQEHALAQLVQRCADEDIDLLLRLAARLASSRQRQTGAATGPQSGARKAEAAADLLASLPDVSNVGPVSAAIPRELRDDAVATLVEVARRLKGALDIAAPPSDPPKPRRGRKADPGR